MREATARVLEIAAEKLADEGWDVELAVRDDYSGRGMYGTRTAGIVIGSICNLAPVLLYAGKHFDELLAEALETFDFDFGYEGATGIESIDDMMEDLIKLRTDNMGRDIIVY